MSRTLTDVLARRFAEDAALIAGMLALVPDGREQWRPAWPAAASGDAPFTVAELAEHLVLAWGGVNGCLYRLHEVRLAHFEPLRERVATAKGAGLRDSCGLLSVSAGATQEGFALTTDTDLARVIPTYFNPAGEPFLEILLTNAKHLNHHAYQLFVYLKLMGVPVGTNHLYRITGRSAGSATS